MERVRFCGMETSWNGINRMGFHGTEFIEWNSWNGISWNGNRIDGTFFIVLSNTFILKEKFAICYHFTDKILKK